MRRRPRIRIIPLLALVLLGWNVPGSSAKAPTLTGFYPAGAARGQSLTVTMSGTFDRWPVKCRVEGDGLSARPATEKGKLSIEVDAAASPGVRWVGIYDEEGSTSLRPFIVGTLPELAESEPNGDPRHPQSIKEGRATINGRLAKTGDVDGYKVHLKRGQTLAADLEANRNLGSPMDAVLQIVSARGFVLAQNNDAAGRDPRVLFEAPEDGAYIVRLFAFPSTPDSSIRFAGGGAYVYRLTLTTGGFIDHAFPLAASRESPTAIQLIGPNLAGADSEWIVPPGDRLERFFVMHPSSAGSAEIRRVTGDIEVEAEPNDPAHPQQLSDRCAVSGRIDPPGDLDAFRIALKKGDPRRLRLESRAFGLPLDAVLRVLDDGGKILADLDDVGDSSDPELVFAPPEDGDYRVVIRDLNRRGGPRHAYLVSVTAPEPELTLTLAADTFAMSPGKEAKIGVTINRRDGFNDTLDITADGLPAGVSATTARSRQSDATAKSVTIEIRAAGPTQPGPFRVVARPAHGKGREQTARAKIAGFEATTDRLWVTILPVPATKKP